MTRLSLPLALTLCALTACQTWKVQSAPPSEVLATTRKQVRLTLTDGTQHTVNLARALGDSVVGVQPRPTRTGRNSVSYPLADVRQLEVGEVSSARTLGLFIGIVAGWAIVLAIVLPPDPFH